jgi:sugar O-acyltransferase (sialic acid O-acetyltransferase NeuD family)
METKGRSLLIFPYNGNGLEAVGCVGSAYEFTAFVDDTPQKQGLDRNGYSVFTRGALASEPDAYILAVPGSPKSYRLRKAIIGDLCVEPRRFAQVIHPSAWISPLAKIGHNVLIMAGAVITSNAIIGNHVCVLANTVIHHDVVVGNWSLVGSSVVLAGNVIVGENCYIGSGTTIMNDLEIGDGALVGIGSNVLRDIAANAIAAGNPARQIR